MRTRNAWWTAMTAGLVLASGAPAAPVDETAPCDKDGTVTISNVAGSVRVEAHESAEVRVTGTIDDEVEDVRVESRAGDVSIEVVLPRRVRGGRGDADLVVRVPAGADLEVETVSASIEVTGTRGDLELESVSGDVSIRDAKGEAAVSSVSGTIELIGIAGEIEAESVSGTVMVAPSGAPVSVETTSGRIRIEEGKLTTLSCTSVSGEIEVRIAGEKGAAPEIELENFSGGIVLEVPESLGAELSVETFSGSIETEFGGRVRHEKMGPGASLEESWGDGSARITLSTFSGSVDVRKAGRRKAEKE